MTEEITMAPAEEQAFALICTGEGRIVRVSDGLRAYLGYDPTGRRLSDYLSDKLLRAMLETVRKGISFPFRGEFEGRSFSAEAVLEEGELRIRARVQEKKEVPFLSLNASRYLAREINEDLAVMLPTLASLESGLDGESGEKTALLRRGLFRLMRLSRNMEDCAAVENGAVTMLFSRVDPGEVCEALFQRLQPMLARMGVRLESVLPQEETVLWADREKLIRMILNLISNAVAARPEKDAWICLSAERRGSQYRIIVTDNGPGLDTAAYNSLRRKYEQSDPREYASGGAGFGLTLTEAYAKRHKGALMVTGGEEGTTACILLRTDWEPPENERLELGSRFSRYGAGIDPVLVELSTVLPVREYGKT